MRKLTGMCALKKNKRAAIGHKIINFHKIYFQLQENDIIAKNVMKNQKTVKIKLPRKIYSCFL